MDGRIRVFGADDFYVPRNSDYLMMHSQNPLTRAAQTPEGQAVVVKLARRRLLPLCPALTAWSVFESGTPLGSPKLSFAALYCTKTTVQQFSNLTS